MSQTASHMNLHMIIGYARVSVHTCREDISEVIMMPEGTRICSQAQAIVNDALLHTVGKA